MKISFPTKSLELFLRNHMQNWKAGVFEPASRALLLAKAVLVLYHDTRVKILSIHNFYQSHAPSGEDAVVGNEIKLLRDHGHEIITYERYNDSLKEKGIFFNLFKILPGLFWSPKTFFDLRKIIKDFKPDVAHIHNLFYLLSPSVYDALRSEKIPVVHTLHNYRLFCPGALLMRDGEVCEKCLGKSPLRSVRYGCFRDPFNTLPLALALAFHKAINTWNRKVDIFITLTEFARDINIKGGLNADKIAIKPNFLSDPPEADLHEGSYALFIGRISREKGIQTLIQAWEGIDFPLKILGNGPLLDYLKSKVRENKVNAEFLGQRPFSDVMDILKDALFLVMPSEWYEGFPMVIREAFACGKPVLASRLGGMAEIVKNGETGYHFEPGDTSDLALKAKKLIGNPQDVVKMGGNARREFENKYSADINYKILMNIYHRAIDNRKR